MMFQVKMKTHSRNDITYQFPNLHPCKIHGCKPVIAKMIIGKRKETMYVANCEDDDCGKIDYTAQAVVDSWNKWNPINNNKNLNMNTKSLRTMIHSFIISLPALNSSREVALVNTSLQRSFAWLGESLKHTGSTSPYVESENPQSTVIEPTADVYEIFIQWDGIPETQTARVKHLRSLISSVIEDFDDFKRKPDGAGADYDMCLKESYVSLKDAKIWLGWELARIKKEIEFKEAEKAGTLGYSPGRAPLPL